jgi:2-polyprenyl-6-methoxyphenol hydroxylase-like FAD-dependent oxidoreductase
MVFGRVALLGDAAFVARPHVGAGVTKAALDAVSLAAATSDGDVAAGLLRYEREQQPVGKQLVALGRREGAFLSAQIKPREQRGEAELKRTVHEVIRAHVLRSETLREALAAAHDQQRCSELDHTSP